MADEWKPFGAAQLFGQSGQHRRISGFSQVGIVAERDAGRKALARGGDRPRRAKISIRLVVLMMFVVGVLVGVCVGALMIAPA